MPLHSSSGRWRLGLALSLVTVCLWGVLPIALVVSLQAVDVYTLTWFRFLVAFGLLMAFLASRQQLPTVKDLALSRQILALGPVQLLAIATVGLALNYVLFLQGLVYTSPGNTQVLSQLSPVLLGFAALVVFKERYSRRQWFGLGLLSLGLTLFFNQQLSSLITTPTRYLLGSGLVVLAAAFWVMYALAQKQLLQQLSSSSIMLGVYGGCALLLSPLASPTQLLTLNPMQWGMLVFAALNTLIAYGAFAEALAHWEASRVSAVLSLTPMITLGSMVMASSLWPGLVAPEQLTALGVVGAIAVVLGSCTIALGQRPARSAS